MTFTGDGYTSDEIEDFMQKVWEKLIEGEEPPFSYKQSGEVIWYADKLFGLSFDFGGESKECYLEIEAKSALPTNTLPRIELEVTFGLSGLSSIRFATQIFHHSQIDSIASFVRHCTASFPYARLHAPFAYCVLRRTKSRDHFDSLLVKLIRYINREQNRNAELEVLKYMGQPHYSYADMEKIIARVTKNERVAKEII